MFHRVIILGMFFGLVVLLLVLFFPMIWNWRTKHDQVLCAEHLQSLWRGITVTETPNRANNRPVDEIPSASIFQPNLPVSDRLSWLCDSGYLAAKWNADSVRVQQMDRAFQLLDRNQSATANVETGLKKFKIPVFLCPAGSSKFENLGFATTQYVANGGIGEETPILSYNQSIKTSGAFKYDETTPIRRIQEGDGSSQTILVLETGEKLGPWMNAGIPTLRTMEREDSPFEGPNKRFGGFHATSANCLFVDGSVRRLAYPIHPGLFRNHLTITGAEGVVDDE